MTAASNAPVTRRTGVTVPLFSVRTAQSWGLGEVLDLVPLARWLASSGVRLVQLLPLGEIAANESSPYGALSAFALAPNYLSVHAVPELEGLPLSEVLGDEAAVSALREAQASNRVDYERVRFVKERALGCAWRRFAATHLGKGTAREKAFGAFVQGASEWLEDYALFRALRDMHEQKPWWQWAEPLRDREPGALASVSKQLANEVQRYRYVQFLLHEQWAAMRAEVRALGVQLMGDLPFVVGRDSVDVWAHQDEFRLDMNVGAPPDQFDPEGQDWGLPPYRWDVMHARGLRWLRRRASAAGALYDCFRVDHMIGFYRTFVRPSPSRDASGRLRPGAFDPEGEPAQLAHGESVLTAMRDAAAAQGAQLIAEDLGVIPDAMRASLTALDIPGYKVLRWEKDGSRFRDVRRFAKRSVACFSTHDTSTLAAWWDEMGAQERTAFRRAMALALPERVLGEEFTTELHGALLELLLSSPSELALLLLQDVFGTYDRINVPGTVGPQNWTWRFDVPLEALRELPGVRAAMSQLRALSQRHGR